MKICFLLPFNGISGGIFTVYEHAKRLAQKGHDVLVAFERTTSPVRVTLYPGMDSVPTKQLDEIAADEEFDIAFATWWETAYSLTRVRARRYCYFVQGFEERFYDRHDRLRYFLRKTYQENLHLFTVTYALRDYLREQFGREATVIRNAINFEWFHDVAPRIPRRDPARLRVLVEGAASVPFKRIPLAFSVLDEVPEVETIYLSPEGRGEPHWRIDHEFTQVPYGDVPGIYASADVLLKLSCEGESFALPVLETFASGGTAVVGAFQGHSEYIRDGVNALVVPIDDRESAVRALRKLVSDPGLRRTLQTNAKETCREFSWDRSSARLEAALHDLPRFPPLRILPALRGDLVNPEASDPREPVREGPATAAEKWGRRMTTFWREARRGPARLRRPNDRERA